MSLNFHIYSELFAMAFHFPILNENNDQICNINLEFYFPFFGQKVYADNEKRKKKYERKKKKRNENQIHLLMW